MCAPPRKQSCMKPDMEFYLVRCCWYESSLLLCLFVGWLFKLKDVAPEDFDNLMDAEKYNAFLEESND